MKEQIERRKCDQCGKIAEKTDERRFGAYDPFADWKELTDNCYCVMRGLVGHTFDFCSDQCLIDFTTTMKRGK